MHNPAKSLDVPCNGCTVCCREGALIPLRVERGDDPRLYRHHPELDTNTGRIELALDRNPDGSCVYVGEHGCTIHDRSPALCREFDCRRLWIQFHHDYNHRERRIVLARGILKKGTLDAGKARLPTLPDHLRAPGPTRRTA